MINIMTLLGSVLSEDYYIDTKDGYVRYNCDIDAAKSAGIDTKDYQYCDLLISTAIFEPCGIVLYDEQGNEEKINLEDGRDSVHIPEQYEHIFDIICRELVCNALVFEL